MVSDTVKITQVAIIDHYYLLIWKVHLCPRGSEVRLYIPHSKMLLLLVSPRLIYFLYFS